MSPIRFTRPRDGSARRPELAAQQIREDAFLSEVYRGSITALVDGLRLERWGTPRVVEIGAAGGITKDIFPWIETTDVRPAAGVDRVVDGARLPYPDESLDGILAKDALHHIADPKGHFREVARVLRPGARATYLEPNWNLLSRAVFRWLHPEPFDDSVQEWTRVSTDPMDSNQALAYLAFERDRSQFRSLCPSLDVVAMKRTNGAAFLLSGGVHTRTPLPSALLLRLRRYEERCPWLLRRTALNVIVVVRKSVDHPR
jgi:SAM-dependent methyltransferase